MSAIAVAFKDAREQARLCLQGAFGLEGRDSTHCRVNRQDHVTCAVVGGARSRPWVEGRRGLRTHRPSLGAEGRGRRSRPQGGKDSAVVMKPEDQRNGRGGCPETGPEAGDTPSRHVQPAASRRLPPHTHSTPPRAPLAGRSPTLASELTWCAGGGVVLGRSSSSAPKTGRLASRALGSRAPSLSPDLQTVVLLCHRPAERGMYPSPSVRHLQGMVQ